MRRVFSVVVLMLLGSAAQAWPVVFVSPLDGSQTIGPQVIEVTTAAANVDRVEFRVDGVLVGVARRSPYRISHDFGTDPASRQVTATVFSNGYRTKDVATIVTAALTAGESMTVDLVEVPLRVRSRRTVTAADLRVRENSVEQTVREVQPERGPAHFAFVVDRSLSMGGGRLEAALAAVRSAQPLLRPGDTASVILFNHNVSQPQPPAAAQRAVPSGGTSLRDAVASTASESGRTYTIVITDGGDRNSTLNEEEALRRISGTRSMITAIVLGRGDSFLERATRITGGSLVRTRDVGAAVRHAILDINSRYTLVYQSHGTADGWRKVSVTARRSGVDVIAAREGYFAE